MRMTMIAAAASLLAAGPVLAQTAAPSRSTVARRHRVVVHHPAAPSVPTGSDSGKPGTANSANPAPNVPPIQTPQVPLKAP